MGTVEDAIKALQQRCTELEAYCERLERTLDSKKKPKLPAGGVSQIRERFIAGYQKKFGHEYHWGAKENGCAAQWLRTIPLERALWLITWYLAWEQPFIVKKGHPFGLLVSSTVELEAVLNRGGRYYKDVAKSKILNKDIEEKMELQTYVDQRDTKTRDPKIGFSGHGELQNEADDKAVSSKRD